MYFSLNVNILIIFCGSLSGLLSFCCLSYCTLFVFYYYFILSIIIYYYYIYIIYKGFRNAESAILADFRHIITRNTFRNRGQKVRIQAIFSFLVSHYLFSNQGIRNIIQPFDVLSLFN
ncbi:hypothetical protein [Wolbachia phage WO]|nr:hypothetical protein WRi_005690 [Wolbachia sp. wRi]AGJ99698.1 hypothetical protein wHa_02190 [Wolbachia endosymbiont of Drosophila simulans wHa]MBA8765710.1 hypothetical protein [Wolbachia pipientis]PBD15604.1 hypothetical protein CLD06_05280 [Wolbachia endosymbiont of Drosophila subpulchrella]POG52037.1 hypothetical protein BJU59_02400 [Wolbachia sp. wRi_2]BAA89633.1 hypothetical protein [Wolbachia phage WO]